MLYFTKILVLIYIIGTLDNNLSIIPYYLTFFLIPIFLRILDINF